MNRASAPARPGTTSAGGRPPAWLQRLQPARLLYLVVLAACGLGLALIVGLALVRFPLLATYKIHILTLDRLLHARPQLALALVLAAGMLFLIYAAGYTALRAAIGYAGQAPRPIVTLVLLPPLICAGMLLLTHPTTSLDLYDYLYRGHMAAYYGANNFVQTPEDLRGLDRLYWYTAWRRATTAYGPLWETLSSSVAWLSGPRLLGLMLGFKLAALAGWLLVALAIGYAGAPAQRLLRLYLWLWNPLVLWELVGAAHNDGWMVACVVLALANLPRRPTLALLLLTAGALLKYPAALLWPVLLAAALALAPDWHARWALAMRAAVLSSGLVVLAYAPWWAGPAMFEQLRSRTKLFTSSPLALLDALLREHAPQAQLQQRLSLLGLALLAAGVLVAAWWAYRRPGQITPVCAVLLAWFLCVGTPWFQPWYLSWPIALLALQPQRTRALLALGALSLGALLTYPAFSALRPLLGWPAKEARWQALIVALIYLPPLLVALVGYARARLPFGRAASRPKGAPDAYIANHPRAE